jgi:hypothetical protein
VVSGYSLFPRPGKPGAGNRTWIGVNSLYCTACTSRHAPREAALAAFMMGTIAAMRRIFRIWNRRCHVRFDSTKWAAGEGSLLRRLRHPFRTSHTASKNIKHKQILRAKRQSRSRVICATPLEKGPSRGFHSGSNVACADVLGNCDRATEGASRGRPDFRWFA